MCDTSEHHQEQPQPPEEEQRPDDHRPDLVPGMALRSKPVFVVFYWRRYDTRQFDPDAFSVPAFEYHEYDPYPVIRFFIRWLDLFDPCPPFLCSDRIGGCRSRSSTRSSVHPKSSSSTSFLTSSAQNRMSSIRRP